MRWNPKEIRILVGGEDTVLGEREPVGCTTQVPRVALHGRALPGPTLIHSSARPEHLSWDAFGGFK